MKPDISPKHIRANHYDMICPNSGATTLGMALCYSRVVDRFTWTISGDAM